MQYPHKIQLLNTRFRLPSRMLFFPRARLFFDRIELSGWELSERLHRCIRLDAIRSVDWQAEADPASVSVVRLKDGTSLSIRFAHAPMWKRIIDHRLSWSTQYRGWSLASATMDVGELALLTSSMS